MGSASPKSRFRSNPSAIMGGLRRSTVDVRDMLCAQALALVAQTVDRASVGETIEVLYNAADVKHDLLVWAQEQACMIHEVEAGLLSLERRPVSLE